MILKEFFGKANLEKSQQTTKACKNTQHAKSCVVFLFQSSDAGEYKCVATNDAGTSEGVAMLTVRGAYNLLKKNF